MHRSKIKHLWNGTQYFRKLKLIDLSYSRDLVRTPNISGVPCLERFVLKGCINLVEVHESVTQHKNLAILNLKGCINLKTFPRKLEMNALKELNLSGCSKVKKLPEFGRSMEFLSKLNLNGCKNLVCLPQSIRNLESLKHLKIGGCSKMFSLPNNLTENNALEVPNTSEIAIREVPSSLQDIKRMNRFSFKGWAGLMNNSRSLSLSKGKVFGFGKYLVRKDFKLHTLSGLSMLKKLDLSYCNLSDGSIPDDLGGLSSLEELNLAGNNFVNLASCIANLCRLSRLDLDDCSMLQSLPVLPPSVNWLFALNCTQMAPTLFDPQRIWKNFRPSGWNWANPFWFIIPGIEIPPWFDNQDYFPLYPHIDYPEDAVIASIIVDVPDYCRSMEWWGIAVCLALESTLMPKKYHTHNIVDPILFAWSSKAPDAELNFHLRKGSLHATDFSGQHLYISIFSHDHGLVTSFSKGDQNKLQLIVAVENLCNCNCGKLKLKNFGCRVVCDEAAQVWRNRRAAREVEMPSSSHDKQSRITEITDELEGDEVVAASDLAHPNLHPGPLTNP